VPVFSCGRSLYINWLMVVMVGGNVLHHEKRERNCPGGEMSEGNVQGGCPTPAWHGNHCSTFARYRKNKSGTYTQYSRLELTRASRDMVTCRFLRSC